MKLPDKRSELIRLALADLRKAEKSPKYEVDMGCWHVPGTYRPCIVCLAGAVMAFTLGESPGGHLVPNDFDHDTEDKLLYLDATRDNAGLLYNPEDPDSFHNAMNAIANRLEKEGQ